ncbi:MAG: hypothetical protein ACKOH7_02615 [Solirubrobacterales bacterium]
MKPTRISRKLIPAAGAAVVLAAMAAPAAPAAVSPAQLPKGDFFGCERVNSRLWTCGLFEDSSRRTRVAGSTNCVVRIRTRGERVVSTRVVCGKPSYAG